MGSDTTVQAKGKIRYYEAPPPTPPAPVVVKTAAHSEFLRTGRIARYKPVWLPEERRYLTHDEVAERTGKRLEAAGETSHHRINSFHRSIKFPKIIFHHTLDERPHLGYCHVTAARTFLPRGVPVSWSFYIANFFSKIGEEETFFEHISPAYSRMYFAVAVEREAGQPLQINRTIRKNGLLFQTNDPMEAVKNVLMLGTSNEMLREIIKKL
ncbi:DUF6656 family protein [Neorhizobium galegae]|uniref:DUF6656 family protein n=1 Tax=Neorhizobium galegae TaxID=399 RepID=UPI00062815C2|nr:DUF6656 family protein [Neorhizobium galegae]MCQ1573161.1 hypothetical protein [Neorhizobium galegae]MCQ1808496.1 hypothetical protein [Neorhizobium galegae]MCQ1834159.1 hypothetical protein [Neorhizobium galegae]